MVVILLKTIPTGVRFPVKDGVDYINEAIKASERSETNSNQAVTTANEAKTQSSYVQTQLDTVTQASTIDPAVEQIKVGSDGTVYNSADERIRTEYNRVSSIANSMKKSRKTLKPIVTFVLDDGKTEDYTIMKPFTELYNIPFTSALITSRVATTGYMTMTEINELKALGWEFISHSRDHVHLTQQTTQAIEDDLRSSSEWLESNGLNGDFIVYPFGDYNAKVMQIASKYYEGAYGLFRDVNFAPINNSLHIHRVPFGGDTLPGQDTYEFYKGKVDEAINGSGWVTFVIHPAYPEFDATQQGYLDQLIQYIQSQNVDIMNVSDAYEIFRNTWENFDFVNDTEYKFSALGANGDIYTNVPLTTNIKTAQIERSRTIKTTTAITDISGLPKGSRRLSYLHGVDSHGFPGTFGVLDTNRATSDSVETLSHQFYFDIISGEQYYRKWEGSNWGDLKKLNNVFIDKRDSARNLKAPSEFREGVTYTEISTSYASAQGYPNNAGGLLITEKSSATHGYAKQTYKQFGGSRIWTRTYTTNDTWGGWYEFSLTPYP